MLFIKITINIIRYKLLGTYKEEWEKQTIIHDLSVVGAYVVRTSFEW